jgi:MFS family permease
MSTRTQLFFLWMGVAACTVYVIGFGVFAGFMPPPPPSLSIPQISDYYGEHRNAIRAGMIICMIGMVMIVPFSTIISWHIAKIENDRFPVYAIMQLIGATLTIVAFVIPTLIWIACSYRPDIAPETVRALHDFAWLAFVMLWPEYTLMMFCIAIAAFKDKRADPIWPRWYGYLTLWVGVSGIGGGLAVYFTHGPYAWDGLVGFWLPVAVFGIWLTVTTYLMHTGIRRHAAAEELSEHVETDHTGAELTGAVAR